MLIVVAQCGLRYGVLDTNDNVVEWVYDTDLYSYVNDGVVIEGVSDSGINVNPLYYVNYANIRCGCESNIFEDCDSVRKGIRNYAEMRSGDKIYKVRVIKSVKEGSKVSLDEFSFVADISGWLVKLSNGICTILPEPLFNSLFINVINMKYYK